MISVFITIIKDKCQVLKEPNSIRYETVKSHLKDMTEPREQIACISGANQDHRLLTVSGSDLGKIEGCGSNPSQNRLEVAASGSLHSFSSCSSFCLSWRQNSTMIIAAVHSGAALRTVSDFAVEFSGTSEFGCVPLPDSTREETIKALQRMQGSGQYGFES